MNPTVKEEMDKIKIPQGFRIGHAQDEYTGVTAIIAKQGAVAGFSCMGGAPAAKETELLRSEKMVQKIHAAVLSGGSAYGLEASCGVMKYLREQKIGFSLNKKVIPIVPALAIFDLNDKDYHYPDIQMGYKACENTFKKPESGNIGAGKGATAGKIRGLKNAVKTGLGIASYTVAGITITAVVVPNPLGDIYDVDGKIIAGAKGKNGNFINTEKCLLNNDYLKILLGTNTTIGCIMTDAKITKSQANKLAHVAHYGLARVIKPVHTDYDGDAFIVMASNKKPVLNTLPLHVGVVNAVEQAIINAVKNVVGQEIVYDSESEDVMSDQIKTIYENPKETSN